MKLKKIICLSIGAVLCTSICVNSVFAQSDINKTYNGDADKKQIIIEHGRTAEEVTVMHKELSHNGLSRKTTQYEVEPKFISPYAAGSLKSEEYEGVLNAIKMVRFLAGVPYEDAQMVNEMNVTAQHGAVLLAASDQFTHTPGKPADMSDEFFDVGKKGCMNSNISAGRNSAANAVLGFVYDAGQNNIGTAGHRLWTLQPENQKFGIGFAKGNGSYNGYRVNMYISGNIAERDTYEGYVAWPSAGDFPLQYLYGSSYTKSVADLPWTVNLGKEYAAPSKKDAVVKLVRKSDGKKWIFNSSTPNLANVEITEDKLHFNVMGNSATGMLKTIVFRPDVKSLGVISDGESFSVEVTGIKYADGTDAVISYDINFFDLEKKQSELDSYYADGGMKAYIPTFPVTMNGVTIDNKKLQYPFILYNNITYFPMTYYDSRFLGIGTSYSLEEGLGVFELKKSEEYNGEMRGCSNVPYYKVQKAAGKITVNGKVIDNSAEEYPLLIFRDVTYFPMTWRFCVDEFGWDYSFDFENGLVIDAKTEE